MKRSRKSAIPIALIAVISGEMLRTAAVSAIVQASLHAPLAQVGSIELPHVEGRIDHLAFDAMDQRLFVAALGKFVADRDRLYLAVPHRGSQKAEIRVYEAR